MKTKLIVTIMLAIIANGNLNANSFGWLVRQAPRAVERIVSKPSVVVSIVAAQGVAAGIVKTKVLYSGQGVNQEETWEGDPFFTGKAEPVTMKVENILLEELLKELLINQPIKELLKELNEQD